MLDDVELSTCSTYNPLDVSKSANHKLVIGKKHETVRNAKERLLRSAKILERMVVQDNYRDIAFGKEYTFLFIF